MLSLIIGKLGELIFKEIKGPITRTVNNTIDNKFKEHHEKFKEDLKLKYRYNNTQFDIYSEIWSSLVGVDMLVDKLWDSKLWTSKNPQELDDTFSNFKKNIVDLESLVKKKSLFLNKEHYQEIISLFSDLKKYQHGKEILHDVKKNKTNNCRISNEGRITKSNKNYKDKWKDLVEKLEKDFRIKLSMEE